MNIIISHHIQSGPKHYEIPFLLGFTYLYIIFDHNWTCTHVENILPYDHLPQ